MNHVVMFSGGIGSWACAKRVVAKHGTANTTLLFADTKSEDEDTYRFLIEAAENVGAPLVRIADGRTIWEVFRDEKFLGNSHVDPCSRILKRELCDRWLASHYTPNTVQVYVGIDWTEEHRFIRLRDQKQPWMYAAPLCEPPWLTKSRMHEMAKTEGLRRQRLYVIGSAHANCGGGCVKMGIGGFARLLRSLPERYAEWEGHEEEMRVQLGDVAILKDRTGSLSKPLTLRALRERLEAGGQCDLFEIGGCGCFSDT